MYNSRDATDVRLTDEQLEKELSNMLAVKQLRLKVDAQVMLIKNMDDELVNGSVGKVKAFMTQSEFNAHTRDYDIDGLPTGADVDPRDKDAKPQRQDKQDESRLPVVYWSLPGGGVTARLVDFEDFKIEDPSGKTKASRKQVSPVTSPLCFDRV